MGISKAGDEMLRKLLVNCEHYILGGFGEDSDLRRWGLALVRAADRKGKRGGAEAGGGSGAETGSAAASVVGDWGQV